MHGPTLLIVEDESVRWSPRERFAQEGCTLIARVSASFPPSRGPRCATGPPGCGKISAEGLEATIADVSAERAAWTLPGIAESSTTLP
jgi:hypothetical protein